jgi:hypothetical protein
MEPDRLWSTAAQRRYPRWSGGDPMTKSAQDLTHRLAAVPVFAGLSSRQLG